MASKVESKELTSGQDKTNFSSGVLTSTFRSVFLLKLLNVEDLKSQYSSSATTRRVEENDKNCSYWCYAIFGSLKSTSLTSK